MKFESFNNPFTNKDKTKEKILESSKDLAYLKIINEDIGFKDLSPEKKAFVIEQMGAHVHDYVKINAIKGYKDKVKDVGFFKKMKHGITKKASIEKNSGEGLKLLENEYPELLKTKLAEIIDATNQLFPELDTSNYDTTSYKSMTSDVTVSIREEFTRLGFNITTKNYGFSKLDKEFSENLHTRKKLDKKENELVLKSMEVDISLALKNDESFRNLVIADINQNIAILDKTAPIIETTKVGTPFNELSIEIQQVIGCYVDNAVNNISDSLKAKKRIYNSVFVEGKDPHSYLNMGKVHKRIGATIIGGEFVGSNSSALMNFAKLKAISGVAKAFATHFLLFSGGGVVAKTAVASLTGAISGGVRGNRSAKEDIAIREKEISQKSFAESGYAYKDDKNALENIKAYQTYIRFSIAGDKEKNDKITNSLESKKIPVEIVSKLIEEVMKIANEINDISKFDTVNTSKLYKMKQKFNFMGDLLDKDLIIFGNEKNSFSNRQLFNKDYREISKILARKFCNIKNAEAIYVSGLIDKDMAFIGRGEINTGIQNNIDSDEYQYQNEISNDVNKSEREYSKIRNNYIRYEVVKGAGMGAIGGAAAGFAIAEVVEHWGAQIKSGYNGLWNKATDKKFDEHGNITQESMRVNQKLEETQSIPPQQNSNATPQHTPPIDAPSGEAPNPLTEEGNSPSEENIPKAVENSDNKFGFKPFIKLENGHYKIQDFDQAKQYKMGIDMNHSGQGITHAIESIRSQLDSEDPKFKWLLDTDKPKEFAELAKNLGLIDKDGKSIIVHAYDPATNKGDFITLNKETGDLEMYRNGVKLHNFGQGDKLVPLTQERIDEFNKFNEGEPDDLIFGGGAKKVLESAGGGRQQSNGNGQQTNSDGVTKSTMTPTGGDKTPAGIPDSKGGVTPSTVGDLANTGSSEDYESAESNHTPPNPTTEPSSGGRVETGIKNIKIAPEIGGREGGILNNPVTVNPRMLAGGGMPDSYLTDVNGNGLDNKVSLDWFFPSSGGDNKVHFDDMLNAESIRGGRISTDMSGGSISRSELQHLPVFLENKHPQTGQPMIPRYYFQRNGMLYRLPTPTKVTEAYGSLRKFRGIMSFEKINELIEERRIREEMALSKNNQNSGYTSGGSSLDNVTQRSIDSNLSNGLDESGKFFIAGKSQLDPKLFNSEYFDNVHKNAFANQIRNADSGIKGSECLNAIYNNIGSPGLGIGKTKYIPDFFSQNVKTFEGIMNNTNRSLVESYGYALKNPSPSVKFNFAMLEMLKVNRDLNVNDFGYFASQAHKVDAFDSSPSDGGALQNILSNDASKYMEDINTGKSFGGKLDFHTDLINRLAKVRALNSGKTLEFFSPYKGENVMSYYMRLLILSQKK